MTTLYINYLLKSSICLILLLIVFRVLISKQTHFSLMRFYLIISLILSMILPVIVIPINWVDPHQLPILTGNFNLFQGNFQNYSIATNSQPNGVTDFRHLIYIGLILVYMTGVVFKTGLFSRNLMTIINYIKRNPKIKNENYWLVRVNEEIPPFSFLNFIFVSSNYQNLSNSELNQIKAHERIHIQQLHTFDIIFIELASIVFWFNPLMKYLKRSIQEIHEFIVDEKIAGVGQDRKDYAELLLSLASDYKRFNAFNLTASFSGSQIKRRLEMIVKTRSLPIQKLLFIVIIPITALMLFSFSYFKNDPSNSFKSENIKSNPIDQQSIGKITWSGNTIYSADTLNQALGFKTGDQFEYDTVMKRLSNDVASLYLDNGYVFHKSDLTTSQIKDGKVDLSINVTEGVRAKIGEISFNGNVTVPGKEILANINLKSGDFFSKEKIILSIRAIAAMGKFDPEKIQPQLIPRMGNSAQDYAVVDINFELTEIIKK